MKDDTLHISWKARAAADAQPALSFAVRYTADGKKWRAIVTGLEAHSFVIDLAQLPGGDACRVQVVASAGLRTATATTAPFARNQTRRRAFIASPKAGTEVPVGELVHLIGGAIPQVTRLPARTTSCGALSRSACSDVATSSA